jgi:hypothetical protein
LIPDCAPWDFPKSTKEENYNDKIQETIEARTVKATSPIEGASSRRIPNAFWGKVKRAAKTLERRLANLAATQEAFRGEQ